LYPSGLVDDLELVELSEDAKLVQYSSGNLYKLKDGRTVRLFRKGLVGDPNLVNLSVLSLDFSVSIMENSLGLRGNFENIDFRDSFDQTISTNIYYLKQQYEYAQDPDTGKWRNIPTNIWHVVYFDSNPGLLVKCDLIREYISNKTVFKKVIHSYAGPEGISQNPENAIGRFTNLLRHNGYWQRIVFDKNLQRFFKIDFENQVVTKGPQLDFMPVQFGWIGKNTSNIQGPLFTAPRRPLTEKELADDRERKRSRKKMTRQGREVRSVPVLENMRLSFNRDFTAVLDPKGQICRLDRNSLEPSESIASLPNLDRTFPSNLFAYDAKPFFIGDEYKGFVVGAFGADLFNSYIGGTITESKLKRIEIKPQHLWENYGGWPALTISKFILESFQPAIFNIAACLFSPDFDAAEDPRSLFIQPDSVMGMIGRSNELEGLERFFLAVAAVSPSLLLGVLLAGWVSKDSKRVGLGKTANSLWTAGTIAFGLSALITYLLTRPKDTLVTCQNCGRLRRPDMDLCHQCHSKWNIPELAPPEWRVLDQYAQPGSLIKDVNPIDIAHEQSPLTESPPDDDDDA
jgi:hypothetical protein